LSERRSRTDKRDRCYNNGSRGEKILHVHSPHESCPLGHGELQPRAVPPVRLSKQSAIYSSGDCESE
jgi:hypothetical protein